MKLGIDARTLGTSRALGRYTKNLLVWFSRLDNPGEFYIFVDSDSQKAYEELGIVSERWHPILTLKKKLLRDHFLFASMANRYHLDLFFHPDNVEFVRMPIPSVVTVHDLMPYLFPDLILDGRAPRRLWQKLYFKVIASAIRSNTSEIVTVSQHTKNDVVKVIGYPAEKIQVIYEGVEDAFLKMGQEGLAPNLVSEILRRYKITAPYIFYLGGLNRHKNVSTLVEAYSLAVKNGLAAKLVIGGKTTTDTSSGQNVFSEIINQISRLDLEDRVIFTGFIQECDLPVIYHQAQAYVFPSFYEGFGFGPLEAMASGCPVIVSNAASLPEVVGEAGVLVAPNDTERWAKEMLQVASDEALRASLRQKGRAQASKFSWRRCAEETLVFFERLVE